MRLSTPPKLTDPSRERHSPLNGWRIMQAHERFTRDDPHVNQLFHSVKEKSAFCDDGVCKQLIGITFKIQHTYNGNMKQMGKKRHKLHGAEGAVKELEVVVAGLHDRARRHAMRAEPQLRALQKHKDKHKGKVKVTKDVFLLPATEKVNKHHSQAFYGGACFEALGMYTLSRAAGGQGSLVCESSGVL